MVATSFDDLDVGDYAVEVDPASLPAGYEITTLQPLPAYGDPRQHDHRTGPRHQRTRLDLG